MPDYPPLPSFSPPIDQSMFPYGVPPSQRGCGPLNAPQSGGGYVPPPISAWNFNTNVVVGQSDGPTIATPFPKAKKISSIKFQTDINIFSIILGSSIINFGPGAAGVFAVTDQADTIDLTGAFGVYIPHLSLTNSIVGTVAPTSRSNAIAFGEHTALRLPANQEIGIYFSADATAGTVIAAVMTIVWELPSAEPLLS